MRTLILTVSISALSLGPALAGQPAGKINPCTLVAKADVQQAVGKALVADPKPNQNNATVCDFKVGDFGNVSFMATAFGGGDAVDRTIAELRKRNIKVTETKGLGDRSFLASPGYGMTQLNAYKGSNYIIITVLIPGATEDKQAILADQLMRKALAKL